MIANSRYKKGRRLVRLWLAMGLKVEFLGIGREWEDLDPDEELLFDLEDDYNGIYGYYSHRIKPNDRQHAES